jgi:hypothetical protein
MRDHGQDGIEADIKFLAENAAAIRELEKSEAGSSLEIGRRLNDCRRRVRRGQWISWLARECAYTQRMARYYLAIYELARQGFGETISTAGIGTAAACLLARSTTPEAARQESAAARRGPGGAP